MSSTLFLKSFSIVAILVLINTLLSQATQGAALKDFRSSNQKAALLGVSMEGVDSETENRLSEDLRKAINKMTRSFGALSIVNFRLGDSNGGQFYAPVSGTLADNQKKFFKEACASNEFDIPVLARMEARGVDIALSMQLFDCRIETLSSIEQETMAMVGDAEKIQQIVYRLFDHLDRDGFVHSSRQGFLVAPERFAPMMPQSSDSLKDDIALDPSLLSSGRLAGTMVIGGDKRPFWETPWFWGVLSSSLIVAGGLSYYFLVVDKPPTSANVQFAIP